MEKKRKEVNLVHILTIDVHVVLSCPFLLDSLNFGLLPGCFPLHFQPSDPGSPGNLGVSLSTGPDPA